MDADQESVGMPEVYAAVSTRRAHFDNLLWQVPALTVTAQAFLFTTALSPDSRFIARLISCLLSLLVTFLTLNLFARHRLGEISDSRWLEAYESRLYGQGQAHGHAWQKARDETDPNAWLFAPLSRLASFRIWTAGLSLFGIAALAVLFIAIFWPKLLQN